MKYIIVDKNTRKTSIKYNIFTKTLASYYLNRLNQNNRKLIIKEC